MKKETLNKGIQLALVAAVMATALPELGVAAVGTGNYVAGAGSTFAGLIQSTTAGQAGILPWILSITCWIMGAFLMVKGALKLKKHAENPSGGDTVAQGLANLIAGGFLAAIPYAYSALAGSISNINAGASFDGNKAMMGF